MSLRDVVDVTETIEFGKGENQSFEVRGLSTEDLAALSGTYDKHLDKLFKGELNFGKLIKEAPAFVASVISLAADDPKAIEFASKLSFGVQVKALKTIYDLTFPDEEFLGNLISQLTVTFRELQGKLASENDKAQKEETSKTGEKQLSKQSSG